MGFTGDGEVRPVVRAVTTTAQQRTVYRRWRTNRRKKKSHRQMGQPRTVEEYRQQFQLFARPLRGAKPEYLKGIFLNGLKDLVTAKLKLHQGQDLRGVTLPQGLLRGIQETREISLSRRRGVSKGTPIVPLEEGRLKGYTRLSYKRRPSEGLCFRCDEKFGPGHLYKETVPSIDSRRGKLWYKPKGSSEIHTLLTEYHSSAIGCHSGFFRIYKRLAALGYWGRIANKINIRPLHWQVFYNYYLSLHKFGSTSLWICGGLPKAQGKNAILVVVDKLTKYAHFIPLGHPFTAKDIAELFLKEIVWLHGFPSTIISDTDKIFLSYFWTEMFRPAGTNLKFSSAYYSRTDGRTGSLIDASRPT
ncbi:Tf2-6, partial [Mucuna pruriens]